MKLKYLLVSALLSTAAVNAFGQSPIENPITKAMMEVYRQELEADPQNYEVYFRRANEYYNVSQYLRALSDINEALKYTPVEDNDLRFQEYTLRANIYLMLERYQDALADLTSACDLDPTSLTSIYLKANTEYELGMYNEAKTDFNKLQRLDSHNLESLFGLARIAVKENNLGLANEYADRAVTFEPSNSVAYQQRASVRQLMGNNNGAVDDLLVAISVDKDNTAALARLVAMSNVDYNAVINGLSSAIQQAPAVGMFVYLRATIAMAHYRYKSAINDFHLIIDENLYNYHGIYGSLAQCYYGLGKYQEALTEVNQAMSMTSDNGNYYVLRAKIRRAMDDFEKAYESAATALDKAPDSPAAMAEKGLCAKSMKEYREASDLFGEAIMDEPDNVMNYIYRAQLLSDFMKEGAAARSLYQRALDIDYPETSVKSLKGFVYMLQGNKADAISWIESILSANKDIDGSLNYYAACLYSHLDMTEKAFACMETSLENGYADYYNWTRYDDSVVSVTPLRKNSKFNNLLERYNYLFN